MYGCLVFIAIIAVQCYAIFYYHNVFLNITPAVHHSEPIISPVENIMTFHALINVTSPHLSLYHLCLVMLSFIELYISTRNWKISSVDVLHQSVQLQLNSNYCQYSLCDCAKSLETSYRKGGWEISILVAAITTYRWHRSVCEEISLWFSRNT